VGKREMAYFTTAYFRRIRMIGCKRLLRTMIVGQIEAFS
jgi:hypothetical protein